jgi:AGCS family alanine or glycine:cation symporter
MSVTDLLPLLITFAGAFFLIRLRFFFIAHPIKIAKKIKCTVKNKRSRKSLALALAGTLGVGNIVGVAYGISVGGAGSLFWIFISGIFASVIKYAESSLAADKLVGGHGGMMYVLSSSFGRCGKLSGTLYAFLCLLLSLSMGSALQSRSAVFATHRLVRSEPIIFAFIFALLCAVVVFGGAKKIESATSFIIPTASIVYIIICLIMIIENAKAVPAVLSNIMSDALNFKSTAGGVSGFLISKSLKEGYSRGLLSNESGAGTSAMAETRQDSLTPADVGLLGMCEVFFDTSLLCTLTGLAVLSSTEGTVLGTDGMEIVLSAVRSSVGMGGECVVILLVFAFAYSTVICWYYYGCECLKYLVGDRGFLAFTALFILFSFIGFIIPENILIRVTDVILFLMSLLCISALIKNSERIVTLSEENGLLKKSDSRKKRVSR